MGIIALCEDCWSELSVYDRLPYYLRVVMWWNETSTRENMRNLVEKVTHAVLSESPYSHVDLLSKSGRLPNE